MKTNGTSSNGTGPIKMGVIGVGHLGQHHARVYDNLQGVDLVGVVDTDETQGRKISRRHNTNFYNDLDDLIPHLDAASVVVPTEDHYPVGKKLIENDIDCLIEKPMVQTLEEAEELYQLSCDRDVLLQVGHIERFNTAFDAARDYIDSPRYIEVNRLGPFTERSIDIGVVLDLMIHDIDIILSLVDSPLKEIKSVGVSVLSDFEDLTNTRLEFENGCVANLTASRVSMETRREIKIFQDKNYVSLDYMDQDVKVWRLKNGKANSMDDVEVYKPHVENGESLRRELSHFVNCIQEDREPVVGGDEGRHAVKVGLDVVEAMKQENKLNGIHG
jgi:predicted dehydrogenase